MNNLFDLDERTGQATLSDRGVFALAFAVTDDSVDREIRLFIIKTVLNAFTVEPELADLIRLTILSTLQIGVEATLEQLREVYNDLDMQFGADRVEQALAEGSL